MYKFIKVKNQFNNDGHQWFFKPESVNQIIEHFEKYFGREVARGIKDRMTEHHATTHWRAAVDVANWAYSVSDDRAGESWFVTACKLESQTLKDRIDFFLQGRNIYLSAGLSYTIPNDNEDFNARIEETIDSETLSFPEDKLKASNARYLQWPDGRHWYAKIGNLDVFDKHGKQKWNSKAAAQAAVK